MPITGEAARAKVTTTLIHRDGRRRHRPFVAVGCALFSEAVIESGCSATSAVRSRALSRTVPAVFELAEGGPIFLDDIDDVPRDAGHCASCRTALSNDWGERERSPSTSASLPEPNAI